MKWDSTKDDYELLKRDSRRMEKKKVLYYDSEKRKLVEVNKGNAQWVYSCNNLCEETLKFLQENGKTESSVKWVSVGEKQTSWTGFKELASFYYDSGFGCEEINLDLEVVGYDWWIERHEYDGSEWWEYKELPDAPTGGELQLSDIIEIKVGKVTVRSRGTKHKENNDLSKATDNLES